jgi:hypothetical protein
MIIIQHKRRVMKEWSKEQSELFMINWLRQAYEWPELNL